MNNIASKKSVYEDITDRRSGLSTSSSPVNNSIIPPIKTKAHLELIELIEIINGFIELIKEEFSQENLTLLTPQTIPIVNDWSEFKQEHQKLSNLADEVFHLYLNLEHCRISQEQNWPIKYQLIISDSPCY